MVCKWFSNGATNSHALVLEVVLVSQSCGTGCPNGAKALQHWIAAEMTDAYTPLLAVMRTIVSESSAHPGERRPDAA